MADEPCLIRRGRSRKQRHAARHERAIKLGAPSRNPPARNMIRERVHPGKRGWVKTKNRD
jgi:hypothetical protein